MWGRACARTSMITPLVRSSSCFATRTAGFCWIPVRIARSRVNLRPPAVRVAVETRVRFGVAVGVGLGTRMGSGVAAGVGLGTRVGVGVAVGAELGTRVGVGVAVGATE